ncbi:hypothetical protein KY305_14075 [Bacillus sp. YC2]|nr:hypothetical protein [Bacillus sp. YC2]
MSLRKHLPFQQVFSKRQKEPNVQKGSLDKKGSFFLMSVVYKRVIKARFSGIRVTGGIITRFRPCRVNSALHAFRIAVTSARAAGSLLVVTLFWSSALVPYLTITAPNGPLRRD